MGFPCPPIPVRLTQPRPIGTVPGCRRSTNTRPASAKPTRITYSTTAMATWVRGDADPGDGGQQHDEAHDGANRYIRPRICWVGGAEHGKYARPEVLDAGDGTDNGRSDHQPAGHEAQVRVDRPANPLEGRAAVSVHLFSRRYALAMITLGSLDQDDQSAAVSRRRGESASVSPTDTAGVALARPITASSGLRWHSASIVPRDSRDSYHGSLGPVQVHIASPAENCCCYLARRR